MWRDFQIQVKQLMESTGLGYRQIASYLTQQLGRKVHPAEVSHAFNDERGKTPKGRQILTASHEYLTQIQEQQNKELRSSMRRAEKALSSAQ